MSKKVLVTGAAGFIGYHLCKSIATISDFNVIGLDNLNNYYDVKLKYARLGDLNINISEIDYNKVISAEKFPFKFIKLDINDNENIKKLFDCENFDIVINLAAQAGVRYCFVNPKSYIDSNIIGFFNILEACRQHNVKLLLYASSSSVYGNNTKFPFSEEDSADKPISLYAATKRSNELLAYNYTINFNLSTIGLRFFTVYGPWGRPDMAYFSFTNAIIRGDKITLFNEGNMYRDFTYIDDIIIAVKNLILFYLKQEETTCEIFNVGNNKPIRISDMIEILSKIINKKAILEFATIPKGDVFKTFADLKKINKKIQFKPNTNIEIGLTNFVEWYKKYFNIN